jgi:glycosyltransferase involved in cell wall biosynthesis
MNKASMSSTPSISVLIIAHNEEKRIAKCISSVLSQTRKPDEVLVVVHNSADATRNIAEQYPVRVDNFNGPAGIVPARLRGLELVSGDIVLCMDGDAVASGNWVETLSNTLQERENILVGSRVHFIGNLFSRLFNRQKGLGAKYNEDATRWIWGPSFGFWKKNISSVRDILIESVGLSEKLELSRNPEDYWLALYMSTLGNIQLVGATYVTVQTKEQNSSEATERAIENSKNGELVYAYFKEHPHLIARSSEV